MAQVKTRQAKRLTSRKAKVAPKPKKPTGFDAVLKERLVPINNGFGSWKDFLFGDFTEVGQSCLNLADHVSLDECLSRKDLDFDVQLFPASAMLPVEGTPEDLAQGSIWTPNGGEDGAAKRLITSDAFLNVRMDTLEVMGPVGAGYNALPYRTTMGVARALDLVSEGAGNFIGAAGLKGGRQAAVIYALPPLTIGEDEEVLPICLVWSSHDGTKAVEVTFVPVRVACFNGNLWHVEGTSAIYRVKHTAGADAKLDVTAASEALSKGSDFFGKWMAEQKKLLKKRLSLARVDELLMKLTCPVDKAGVVIPFELPKQQKAATIAEKKREAIRARYLHSPDVQNLPMGGYRLLQAVAEYVDREGRTRVVDDGRQDDEGVTQKTELDWLRAVQPHKDKEEAKRLILAA